VSKIALTDGPYAAGFWGLSKKSTKIEETKSPRAAKTSEVQNTHVKPEAIKKNMIIFRASDLLGSAI